MWLNRFKIALVEQNTDSMNKLMDSIPEFQTQEEMQEALFLIDQAREYVLGLKEETKMSLEQIQKSKSFLKSTQVAAAGNLDIKS